MTAPSPEAAYFSDPEGPLCLNNKLQEQRAMQGSGGAQWSSVSDDCLVFLSGLDFVNRL